MRFHDPELARQRKGVLDSLIREMRDKYSWDEQPCVVCGEDPARGETISKWGIQMRFCPSCNHLFTSPRMEERGVPDLYGSFYWEQYQVAIGSPSIQERMQFDYDNGQHKLLRDVLPFRTSGRFLDVGASSGGLVKKAQEAGFQAAGIEPAGEIAEMARKVHGVEMFEGTLIEQQFDAESFDVITLHDVLEHLFEPVRDLREMVRVLAPGGILAIETPTSSSLNYLDQGIDWTTISPLEHVHLFNEANIARLVEERGLAILDLYSPHEDNWILVAQKPL